jgi:hypothetical protein
MKQLNNLMQDIIKLSAEIETNYPELYKYLDETPLPIMNPQGKEISPDELNDYLNTLKKQLNNHISTHEKKFVQV